MATDYIGIATLVSSVTGSIVALVTLRRGAQRDKRMTVLDNKVDVVHDLVNDLSDKRAAAAEKSGHAEGVLVGRDQERRNPTIET